MARVARDLSRLPGVDQVLRSPEMRPLVERYGRLPATEAIRSELSGRREALRRDGEAEPQPNGLAHDVAARLEEAARPSQRPVLNLTGTVLHTNLGRALLAEEAVAAAVAAMTQATNLEFDLEKGGRGERDAHVEALVCRITGAEAATVVNNGAAALILVLNALARDKDAIVSRGELIEIGGSFRLPDIMERAGCRLVEVGTTNRTHLADYEAAIGPATGVVMKVHTSNYKIAGFAKAVAGAELAAVTRARGVPLVEDLGSGTLVDLGEHGLEREPTVGDAIRAGVDLVTFSGDKLLGGPQVGIVAGRAELVAKLNKNPLKRALRVDKIRMAALEATLRLYLDPDRLAARLPTLRLLTRPADEIAADAGALLPHVERALGEAWRCEVVPLGSQIGSGALPLATMPSAGLAIRPAGAGSGRRLNDLAAAFRRCPVPVIGRIEDDALILDLRCLPSRDALLEQLARLPGPARGPD